ncbi:WNT8A protein, partial [Polyodon spathula]|nr:WNT8A protein [Polyodon spathula]
RSLNNFIMTGPKAFLTYSSSVQVGMGDLENCGCGDARNGHIGRSWILGGYSDNVKFGERISKEFVDALEAGIYVRAAMKLHNKEASRIITFYSSLSNSDALFIERFVTSELTLQMFVIVTECLKLKHGQALKLEMAKRRMHAGNSADNRGAIAFSTIARTELIYFEESPDYMHTEGRECLQSSKNLSQWKRRSCRILCYKCGHKVEDRRYMAFHAIYV